MPIPPEPILRAIARWIDLIPNSGEQRARSLLLTSAQYRDLTPTQYETALAWLRAVGLLDGPLLDSPYANVIAFEHLVGDAGWFPNADLLVREPDELPLDAVLAAEELGRDPAQATQVIRNRRGKVDTSRREEVGAAGELALLALLKTDLVSHVTVEHVAAVSDGLGYDIAVRAPAFECHIEVKSTTVRSAPAFFLSRNEFEVSRFDPRWVLVLVHLSPELRLGGVETIRPGWLSEAAPTDSSSPSTARWESARFEAPPGALEPGIGALAGLLARDGPLGAPLRWDPSRPSSAVARG
ncbi:MAG: DUF3883 domain-containing protein [Cellulomonadaceae bacterium]|nr:DUF3883 domain-containing protein [Cellulomonadaceae bacterium]